MTVVLEGRILGGWVRELCTMRLQFMSLRSSWATYENSVRMQGRTYPILTTPSSLCSIVFINTWWERREKTFQRKERSFDFGSIIIICVPKRIIGGAMFVLGELLCVMIVCCTWVSHRISKHILDIVEISFMQLQSQYITLYKVFRILYLFYNISWSVSTHMWLYQCLQKCCLNHTQVSRIEKF